MLYNGLQLYKVPFDNTYKNIYDWTNFNTGTPKMESGNFYTILDTLFGDSEWEVYSSDISQHAFNIKDGKGEIVAPLSDYNKGDYNYAHVSYVRGHTDAHYYFFITNVESISNVIDNFNPKQLYKFSLELDVWATYYDTIKGYDNLEHFERLTYDMWESGSVAGSVKVKTRVTDESECEVINRPITSIGDCTVLWLRAYLSNNTSLYYIESQGIFSNKIPINSGCGLTSAEQPVVYVPILYCSKTNFDCSNYKYIKYLTSYSGTVAVNNDTQIPSLLSEFSNKADLTWYVPFRYSYSDVNGAARVTILDSTIKCGYVYWDNENFFVANEPVVRYQVGKIDGTIINQPVYCVVDRTSSNTVKSESTYTTIVDDKTQSPAYPFGTKYNMAEDISNLVRDNGRFFRYPYKYNIIRFNETEIKQINSDTGITIESYGNRNSIRMTRTTSTGVNRTTHPTYLNSNGEYFSSASAKSIYEMSKSKLNEGDIAKSIVGLSTSLALGSKKSAIKAGVGLATDVIGIGSESAQAEMMPLNVQGDGESMSDIYVQDKVIQYVAEPVNSTALQRLAYNFKIYGYNFDDMEKFNNVYHIIYDFKKTQNSIFSIANLPDFAKKKLKEIFDNGTHIWHISNALLTSHTANSNYRKALKEFRLDAGNYSCAQYYYGGTDI